MYVKIMGDDNTGDDDSRKTFRLLQQVIAVNFDRNGDDTAFVELTFEDKSYEQFEVRGNAYVMNDQGKTIGKFGSHPVVTQVPVEEPPPDGLEPVPFRLDDSQNIA